MPIGSPRLSFCSRPFRIRDGTPMPDAGLGKVILPFNVSANTAVKNFPISSSLVIPFLASFAERVPLGITTPSKTTSAALLFLVPANAIPLQISQMSATPITPLLEASCVLISLVAPPGLEPGLSALKGPRVNQLHHGAKHTTTSDHSAIRRPLHQTAQQKIDSVAGAATQTVRQERASHPVYLDFDRCCKSYPRNDPASKPAASYNFACSQRIIGHSTN
jgi:hypothetical protein